MPIMTDIPVTVDIGPWMKFSKELFEALKAENAAMAGMTFAEAATALGYRFVSGVGWVKNISVTTEVVSSAVTAGEAIAGATTAAETTTGTIVLTETASGGACALGLGSMATALAAVCLAGAAGYCLGKAIGNAIDEAYPEFFDGLFKSISVTLTGTETGLAFLFDSDGHAYAPEVCKTAVVEYVEPIINALNGESSVTVDSYTVPFKVLSVGDVYCADEYETWDATVLKIDSTTPVYVTSWVGTNGLFYYYMCSKEKFTFTYKKMNSTKTSTSTTSFGGKTNSNSAIKNIERITIPLVQGLPYSTDSSSDVKLLYAKILGSCASAELAPKLEKYEVPAKPQLKVYTSSQTESENYIRIPLPATETETETSTETLPDTIPQLQPEEEEETKKLPVVSTATKTTTTTPSPDVDPSTEPETKTEVDPVPTPNPPDTGSVPVPPLPYVPPVVTSEATGLLHVYNPTPSQVNEFGKWLWTTFSGDILDTVAKLFNNPMDAVIGLHELYCTPITGTSTTIKAGFLDSDVTSRLVSKRYAEINCQAITIPEYWANYLDYAPYTKVHCYLPFVGIVELNPNDVIGRAVQIVYKIDTYNGSCVAMIITAKNTSAEAIRYQFSGNCAVEVPITSGMKSAIQSALIGAATTAIGASAAGVVSKGMLTAAGANGAAQRGLRSENSVSHSGTFGSSFGAMGVKKPYIIVERPVQKVVKGYNEKYGYPAHRMVNVGNCSGYLRCRDFEFKSSTATQEEKKRVEILLKEGVYV